MPLLTKQQRRSQRKLVEQRDAARAAEAVVKSENERLMQGVRVVAAEEIQRVESACRAAVQMVGAERDAAVAERDALVKNFDAAMTTRIQLVQDKLAETQQAFEAARAEAAQLNARARVLIFERDELEQKLRASQALTVQLGEELNSLRMEDTKHLRKRLHQKSERIVELETQLAAAERARAREGHFEVEGSREHLTNLLMQKLHLRPREGTALAESPPPPKVVEGEGVSTVTAPLVP